MLKVNRLRELREKIGLSQRELSRECGLGDNMVFRYENGLSDPTSKSLVLIAQKLEVSTDYLLGLVNYPDIRATADTLTQEESAMLETFRRDGWAGVFRLGSDLLSKQPS